MRYCLFLLVFLAGTLAFQSGAASANTAESSKILQQASKGEWTRASQNSARLNDPLTKKLLDWMAYRDGREVPFSKAAAFMEENPNWPEISKVQLVAEMGMAAGVSDESLVTWSQKYEPITPDAMERVIAALRRQGQEEKARVILRSWWMNASLTRDQQRRFFKKYSSMLDRDSHAARLDALLYGESYSNALALAQVLGEGYVALAQARLGLAKEQGDVESLIKKVPDSLKDDPGLIYERVRWRRRQDLDEGAAQLLQFQPRNMHDPAAWWKERQIIARRLMEKRQYDRAYELVAKHGYQDGVAFAEAEWLAGWLALRFVNKPWEAFEHFERMHQRVETPISKGRAAYWAGRASDALGHPEIGRKWYEVAPGYGATFYGQLAGASLSREAVFNFTPVSIPASMQSHELARAARILHDADMDREAKMFLFALGRSQAGSPEGILGAALVARDLKYNEVAIKLAQEYTQKTGQSPMSVLYPVLPIQNLETNGVEWALTHAIIRQESRFDPQAMSPVGARGLMQLMPETAKMMARSLKVPHDKSWLTNKPAHNIRLGTMYLDKMIERFDGDYVMAIAAYNAGPSRVDDWIEENGDPREGKIGYIDWIELIPFSETRNYVQRVMEGVTVYRARQESGPARHVFSPLQLASSEAKDLLRAE